MKAYVELRKITNNGTDSRAADIVRHLYTRQYLGKAVVVCDQPIGTLSAARKQWLRLSRTLQRQRASTLNADKILKYTHGIAHMQRMRFCAKSPAEQPDADVFFLTHEQLAVLPAQCVTFYLADQLDDNSLRHCIDQLQPDALFVDYIHKTKWVTLGIESKQHLETQVADAWQHVRHFLELYSVDISLLQNELHSVEAMDDALDILLGVSRRFLSVASDFQRTLELARPMRINKSLREKYDSFILLAHRVQALTPGAFSQQFLQAYNEDDTFLLYDHSQELARDGKTVEQTIMRHLDAGRVHLANALRQLYTGRSLTPIR